MPGTFDRPRTRPNDPVKTYEIIERARGRAAADVLRGRLGGQCLVITYGALEACVSIRPAKLPPAAMESGRNAAWETVLSPYVELNSELTRGSRKSGKGRVWGPEGRRDVVRVREISGVRGE